MTFFVSIIILISILGVALFFLSRKRRARSLSANTVPKDILRNTLEDRVEFYRSLNEESKKLFEERVTEFLSRTSIEGVGIDLSETDRILVASGAIIPIFAFPGWHYPNLTNVLIYPRTFDEKFDFEEKSANIEGMVGSGFMNGQMILSKEALDKGFSKASGPHNTAIHEFVHLLDKVDGSVDGVPELLLNKGYIAPWIKLMHGEMKRIQSGHSDINAYALTNEAEFLAVVSEYFFEKPEQFKNKHPELYIWLERFYMQQDSA